MRDLHWRLPALVVILATLVGCNRSRPEGKGIQSDSRASSLARAPQKTSWRIETRAIETPFRGLSKAWVLLHNKSTITAKGCRMAYSVRVSEKVVADYVFEERWAVVVDGKADQYEGVLKQGIVFSPDGRRVALAVLKGGKYVVVVDGQPGPEFDGISKDGIVFSSDGKHVAYVGAYGREPNVVVVDGRIGQKYEGAKDVTMSMDGKRIGYAFRKGGKWLIDVDGQTLCSEYDGCTDIRFDSSGRHVGYTALTTSDKMLVAVDGQAGPEFDGIANDGLVFGPDGTHMAYAARRDKMRVAVVDGRIGPEYDGVALLTLSPDGKRNAYVAERNGRSTVVVDGKPGPDFDGVGEGNLVFSPDGKHVAYAAGKGKERFVVLDGERGTRCRGIRPHSLVFSPDSKRFAYFAVVGEQWKAVVDGRPGETHEDVEGDSPTFSPDGKHVAYAAMSDRKYRAIIDGQPGPEYDYIRQGPTFDLEGNVEYLAALGDAVYCVKHVPVGD